MCTSPTDSFRYFYSWSGGSELFGVSAQTDSGIRIWHSLYTPPEVIVTISGLHLSDTVRYFYSWSGGGLNSLESQLIVTVVLGFGIPYIPYKKLLCLFQMCTSLMFSGISTLGQEGSELFGVSAQSDSGIRICHSLYTLPEVIVTISGVHLSDTFTFRCFSAQTLGHSLYTLPGGGLNSLESQLRLTVVLRFGIPYIPYQKLL